MVAHAAVADFGAVGALEGVGAGAVLALSAHGFHCCVWFNRVFGREENVLLIEIR